MPPYKVTVIIKWLSGHFTLLKVIVVIHVKHDQNVIFLYYLINNLNNVLVNKVNIKNNESNYWWFINTWCCLAKECVTTLW
jgi:hypothetical protein